MCHIHTEWLVSVIRGCEELASIWLGLCLVPLPGGVSPAIVCILESNVGGGPAQCASRSLACARSDSSYVGALALGVLLKLGTLKSGHVQGRGGCLT